MKLFPALEPVVPTPPAQLGPFGHPLTLAELQQIAMANSPVLRQAAADVEAARGAAKQAGAYPNPNFGYESDTAGTSATAGYQGAFLEQIIKTAGKLKVAEASAIMNLLNTELALRRAQTDLMAQVRGGYFAVLVARENLAWNQQLAEFTDRVYGVFAEQMIGGLLAGYEPLNLRGSAAQVRASAVQARNRYLSAWQQLAAAIGKPGMPLTEVAGNAEMALPVFARDAVLTRVLNNHTDIQTARNTLQRARYDLRSAEITPIPDVDVRVAVQKDFTMPPFTIVHSVQVGVPLPVWDQNKGNIRQAQANLLHATEEDHRVRADLETRVADAFERYDNNRQVARLFRNHVLPDLSRSYRGALSRYNAVIQGEAELTAPSAPLSSLEVFTFQQNYITAVNTYAAALRDQWQAVVDLASLMQIDDLFLGLEAPPPVHFCAQLPPLPCGHPCDPLQAAPPPGPALPVLPGKKD
jgi:cobalt-zinc-cadmium efflux system outer membrane protein